MEQPIGKVYSQVVNVLIFIFPIVINSLQVAGDLVLLILAMMGIYVAISQKLSPFIIKDIKVFSYLTIGYFSAVCLSVLFSGQMGELAHYIPRDLSFLFAPFIALALYKAEINVTYLLVGTKVALFIIGMITINQFLLGAPRASGVMNAGVFGNLAVSLFFIVLVFSNNESIKNKIFSIFALLSGFVAIIASGTRGAWLSFLILLGVYFYYKQKNEFTTRSKIISVIIVSIMLTFSALNQSIIERTNSALSEISNFMSGDKAPSSVGVRLEMYVRAIDNIEDVPFFGHGYRTSNIVVFQNDTSKIGKLSVGFNHLHNAFLTNYYNGGVVLLGALLFLLFLPLRIFIKANSQDHGNPIFISGLLLTLGYTSFGMVSILFGDTYMNGFYVFFLAVFMLLHAKSIKAR